MNKPGEYPPDFPRKIVRPRKPKSEDRGIIAISNDFVMAESLKGEVFPTDDLPQFLKTQPSSILVVQGFGKHLQRLQRVYEKDSEFNYRVTPIHRYARPWNDGRRVEQGMIVDAVCNFVGWRHKIGETKSGNPKFKTRYHYPLDPIWFMAAGIDEINDSDMPRLYKLYKWALEVREWCGENELQVKASAGGLAAQLLRDPRFYPEPRRKAPKLVNNIARYQLPGNYYRLYGETGRYYRALYLDMENAHHALARTIRFPCVDSLHAFGHWTEAETDSETPPPSSPNAFAPGDHPIGKRPGLFHARITVPHIPHPFVPPYMETHGERDVFIYSNEFELIKSLGGKVTKIYSAYVSQGFDTGLNKYARWAIEQIRAHRQFKPWLKPTLHAAYGLLAARPTPFETGHFRANGGEYGEYHMGNVSLPVYKSKRPNEIEASIANVIHRGMIEAEVRKQALWYARFLTEVDKHRVLAIYADAMFIEDTGAPLRLLEPPWRLSKRVSSLRFHSSTHFTSPQLSRLPGVPKTARERFLRDRALTDHLSEVRHKPFRPNRPIASRSQPNQPT